MLPWKRTLELFKRLNDYGWAEMHHINESGVSSNIHKSLWVSVSFACNPKTSIYPSINSKYMQLIACFF